MKFRNSLVVATVFACAAPVAALAQGQGYDGTLRFFYSNASTRLEALSIAGRPSFENSGHYWGGSGETHLIGRVGVAGSFFLGQGAVLFGGTDFTAPTFNPLTGEKARILQGDGTYDMARSSHVQVAGTLGYFYLYAAPLISRANSYGGPAVGVLAKYHFDNGLTLRGKVSYVPTYFVHGNVEGELADKNIVPYAFGADYQIAKHIMLTAGYQGFRLAARVTFDSSSAVVVLKGIVFGGGITW